MMDSLDIRSLLRPLLKWWWLLAVSALLASVSSFAYLIQKPSIYESHTSLMVGSVIQNPNPTGQDLFLTQQLASTYADFVKRDAIRQATMDALGMTWLPYYAAHANGQLLEISVTDTDPARAQSVAHELANQVILQGPAGRTQSERLAFVDQRLHKLEEDISATEEEIDRKKAELANELSASKIRRIETDIQTLLDKVNSLQATYSELLSTSQRGAANAVYIFEPAGLPSQPLSKGYPQYLLVAVVFGLALAAAGAYLIEYLDDSVKDARAVERMLQVPALGAVPALPDRDGKPSSRIIMAQNTLQPAAEAYRVLRTNLQFTAVDRDLRLLQVTSPSPGEGKSMTAANLAATLAHGGKHVILVDADFRRPIQHKLFSLRNTYGLTLALLGHADSLESLLQETGVANLHLLTTGPLPPNPSELLGSKRMQNVVMELLTMADVVVIDSPPVTVVSDTAIIASMVDGVLLVLRAGHTRNDYAKRAMAALQHVNARVLGFVLNDVSSKATGYHYDYGYNYGYSYVMAEEPSGAPKRASSRRNGAVRRTPVDVLMGRGRRTEPPAKPPALSGTPAMASSGMSPSNQDHTP